jgi:hypothetical protein
VPYLSLIVSILPRLAGFHNNQVFGCGVISHMINPLAVLEGQWVASSSGFSQPTCPAREALPIATYHQCSLDHH